MTQRSTSSQRPSVRTRFTITSSDLALSGLYKHLQSLDTEWLRSMALRRMLLLKEGFAPDCDVACSNLPSISVRLSIGSRDMGFVQLHSDLLAEQTDTQRRAVLKNAIVRIQAAAMQGAAQPHAANSQQAQPVANAASFTRTDPPAAQTIDRPPALLLPEQIAAKPEAPTPETPTINTAKNLGITIPAVKNPSFKSRMRDASRMFDA